MPGRRDIAPDGRERGRPALAGGPATGDLLAGLCREHAVPDEMVVTLRARLQRLAESGRAAVSPEVRSDPRAMVEDVGFVRKKGEWSIRPLAKRSGAGRG